MQVRQLGRTRHEKWNYKSDDYMKKHETTPPFFTSLMDMVEALRRPLISGEVRRLADMFVSAGSSGRRYLFGRNEHSSALARVLEIDGFVDDFASEDLWLGKPVIKGENLPRNAIVVNCVLMARTIICSNKVRDLRVEGSLEYADLMQAFPDIIPAPVFVDETRADFQLNSSKWATLSNAFADEESKQVLEDVLKFRLSADIIYMQDYTFRPEEQYFEEFLKMPPDSVFVDAGGFDGDTTEGFCLRHSDYKKVFLFEPSDNNLQKAKARLENFHNINFIEKGVSDQPGSLAFDPESGSASSVSETGSSTIQMTKLDAAVQEKVTFIKMDLEGWELKALKGAEKHIREDYPRLAIAVYHHPSHFWQVLEQVCALQPDYRVFLRHYTEGWTETVMFFVPHR